MSTAAYGLGEAVGTLCAIFKTNPNLHAKSIVIHDNGSVEVAVAQESGALKSWAHALPVHHAGTALVSTMYGADEADVIEAEHIKVVVRRPLTPLGGAR